MGGTRGVGGTTCGGGGTARGGSVGPAGCAGFRRHSAKLKSARTVALRHGNRTLAPVLKAEVYIRDPSEGFQTEESDSRPEEIGVSRRIPASRFPRPGAAGFGRGQVPRSAVAVRLRSSGTSMRERGAVGVPFSPRRPACRITAPVRNHVKAPDPVSLQLGPRVCPH